MSDDPTKVKLGEHEYRLVPQRIGRIGRKLPQVFEMFAIASGSAPVPMDVSQRMYDALKVFIPDIAPFYELAGYPNEAGWDKKVEHDKAVEAAKKSHVTKWWNKLGDDDEGKEIKARFGGEKPPFEALPVSVASEFKAPDFSDPRDAEGAVDKSPTPPEIMDAIERIFAVHGGQRLVRLLKNFMSGEAIRETIERSIKRMQIESALRRSQSLQHANGASGPTSSTTPDPTSDELTEEDGLASLQAAS